MMTSVLLKLAPALWFMVCPTAPFAGIQDKDSMPALIRELKSEDRDRYQRAATKILSQWKLWTKEDLRTLAEARDVSTTLAVRANDVLDRIAIRRLAGPDVLWKIKDLEDDLLSRDEETVLAVVEEIAYHLERKTLSPADLVGLVEWIYEKKLMPSVQKIIEDLKTDGALSDPKHVLALLKHEEAVRRRGAIETLVRMRARKHAASLLPLLRDPDSDVRDDAGDALIYLRARSVADGVALLLGEPENEARVRAIHILSGIGARDHASSLPMFLNERLWSVRRDAVTAIANLGATELAEVLVPLLEDPVPQVRVEVVKSLGILEAAPQRSAIRALLASKDAGVRAAAIQALRRIQSVKDIKRLVPLIEDSDWEVRFQAARTIGALGGRAHARALIPLLQDPDAPMRANVAYALGMIGSEKEIDDVKGLLSDKHPFVRYMAVEALGMMGATEAGQKIVALAKDPDARVRAAVAWSLGALWMKEETSLLEDLLRDPDAGVKEEAMQTLLALGLSSNRQKIREGLEDRDPRVRAAAAWTLGRMGESEDLAAVQELFSDDLPYVKAAAARSLARRISLTGTADEKEDLEEALAPLSRDLDFRLEVAVKICSIRLGDDRKETALKLIDDFQVSRFILPDGLRLDLFETLIQTREAAAFGALTREATVTRKIAAIDGLKSFAESVGLQLEVDPSLSFSGTVVKGRRTTLLRLVEERLPRAGFFVEKKVLRILPMSRALERWKTEIQ